MDNILGGSKYDGVADEFEGGDPLRTSMVSSVGDDDYEDVDDMFAATLEHERVRLCIRLVRLQYSRRSMYFY